ncbi:hypothetical protein IG631_23905 [Alternaria alternata]|nr:hypothetical protein IG631_23905 [Alternaria alternata]
MTVKRRVQSGSCKCMTVYATPTKRYGSTGSERYGWGHWAGGDDTLRAVSSYSTECLAAAVREAMAMESMSHRHGIVLYSTLATQSTTAGCIRKRRTLLSAVKTC